MRKGSLIMTTGKRLAGLFLLTSALTFPAAALAQGTQGPPSTGAEGTSPEADADENLAEQVEGIDDTAQEEQFDDPDVSIPGGEIIVTGRRGPRDVTRSSSQVVSVLSSEQIARTGEGDIAGALSRVTGLSVQGNGFVYVRGLGDRYSLALLNGLPLPSPQPLSRVVPLDIFPTNVVASSLVQKTYSANFPGEFGGGVINLTTQAVPDESFLKIGVGTGGDTETTFQNGLSYFGGDIDFLGFDDGRRVPPPLLQDYFDSGLRLSDPDIDQTAIVQNLVNNTNVNTVIAQKIDNLPANFSASVTGGTSLDVGSDGLLGIVATAGISNKWRNRFITQQFTVSPDLELENDFDNTVTDNRILVNGLLGFGLEFGEHQLRWTNLYIRDTLKQTALSQGFLFGPGNDVIRQNTAWFERQLIDTQFVGELDFGDLDVDLRAGYARTQREAPYEWTFEYVRTNLEADPTGDLFVNDLRNNDRGFAQVAFSDLKEDLYSIGADISYPLTDWLRPTIGYAYNDTSRYTERRAFLIDGDVPGAVGALQPQFLLGDGIAEFYDVGLIEITANDPAFQADLDVHGAYGKVILTPLDTITIDAGVRYEDATQRVTPVELFAEPRNSVTASLIANDYWLPAGTITWEAMDGLQIRASASRTIGRPQFRELIFQPYTDPENQRQFIGNPALGDTEIDNFEGRAEYYWGRGNRASLAGFYKDLSGPIEPYLSFSNNAPVTRFANAPAAQLYGVETEFQWNYEFYDRGGWFETKQLVAVANYTYTQSELKVGPDDTTRTFIANVGPILEPAVNFFTDGARLTGQSDHLVNVQLGLEDIDHLQQFTMLFSYASKRVTRRGTAGLPDIFEDPGLRVDFVYRQGFDLFDQQLELKAEARNVFGRGNFEYQSNGTDRIEINSYDVGQSFSISLSAEF